MEHCASYFSEALQIIQSPSKTEMGTMDPFGHCPLSFFENMLFYEGCILSELLQWRPQEPIVMLVGGVSRMKS